MKTSDFDVLIPAPVPESTVSPRWGTITALSPLRVKLDGDDVQLPVTPAPLVYGLAVNDRVWCVLVGRQVVIAGAYGGKTIPAVGTITMWLGDVPPSGELLLQGQAVSRTEYSALFALWGTAYGVGDGSTTFSLPDMRERMPLGASTSYGVGSVGGSNTHVHTQTLKGTWAYSNGNGLKYTAGETVPDPVIYTGSASSLPRYLAINFKVQT